MMETLKIFISSPGDVAEERAISAKVIKRLKNEFSHRVKLEPIFWEHEPLRASASFQDEILLPSETDIVISILWTRLGSRLPKRYTIQGDNEAPTGTEFEIRNAIQAYKEHGNPDLLIYKKTAEPLVSLKDEELVKKSLQQRKMLEQFTQHFFFDDEDNSIKAAFHCFEKSSTFEQTLEEHLRKLIDRKAPPGSSETDQVPSWTSGSPFRGLHKFDLEHAPIFFGRSKAISEVMSQLKAQSVSKQNFILIQGMSGTGKSSLVCAGVLPLLMEPGVIEGIGLWRYAVTKASDSKDLYESLAMALTSENALPELLADGTDIKEIAELLSESKSIIALIRGALREVGSNCQIEEKLESPPKARLILVLDQMEEIFARENISKDQCVKFFEIIKRLAESGLVWVIGTLRSDFYHRCEEVPALMELKEGQGQYHLQPPTATELSQMIRLPARAASISFEKLADGSQLDEVILEQALKSPEALPLLEFCLEELYAVGYKDKLLSFDEYEQIGRFEGALSRKANQVLNKLPKEAQESFPAVMRRLIAIEGDSEVRRWYSESELNKIPGAQNLLTAFKEARLLVGRGKDGEAYLSITHEVLLRNWALLSQLIERDREFLLLRGRVEQSTQQWIDQNKDESYLLPQGRALNEALTLYEDREEDLDKILIEYIKISKLKVNKALQLKRMITMAAILTLVCFTAFALIMWSKASSNEKIAIKEKDKAEKQKLIAEKQTVIAEEQKKTAEEQKKIAEEQKLKAEQLVKDLEKSSNALKQIIPDVLENIHLLVLQKDYIKVENLVKMNPELVNKGTKLGIMPIHFAAQLGDLKMLKLLLQYKADLSIETANRESIYHFLAKSGNTEALQHVLNFETGNSLSEDNTNTKVVGNENPQQENTQRTEQLGSSKQPALAGPQQKGLESEKSNIVALLDKRNDNGETPLHWAVRNKKFPMVQKLNSLKASLNLKDNNDHTPFFYSVMNKNYDAEILNFFILNLGHIDEIDKNKNTILHHTAIYGNIDSLKQLLNSPKIKKLIDKTNIASRTALHLACLYNSSEFILEFLKRGNPKNNLEDDEGFTPIIEAAYSGKLNAIKFLQSEGISLAQKHSGWTLMGRAAMNGHLDVVKYLVAEGADIEGKSKGWTALHLAAKYGHLDVIKFLVDKGANVKCTDYYKYTPLMASARHGHMDILKYLISKGADLNKKDDTKNTSLTFAAGFGHKDIAKFLIENNADIDHQDNYGFNALHYATSLGMFDLAEILIAKGAKLNYETSNLDSAFIFTARKGNTELLKKLLKLGANQHQINKNKNNALIEAAFNGHLEAVKTLIEMGLPLDHKNKTDYTAMAFAAQEGHFEIVKYLVEKKADISIQGTNGLTAFSVAVNSGYLEIAKYLADQGADIEIKTSTGWTPLIYAARKGHIDLVKFLIEKGVNINAVSKAGYNALMAASDSGHTDIIELLLKNGMDIHLKDKDGYDAFLGAVERGELETVKLLLKYGASIKSKTISNYTPLMTAANTGKTHVVKYLLDIGCDIEETNKGWTALFYAATRGHLDTVQLLVNRGAVLTHKSSKGTNLLIETVFKGQTDIVEFLIQKGLSVNSMDNEQGTAAMFAAQAGHLETVKLLWNYGADFNHQDVYGYDIMLMAINSENIELIKYLISKKVDLHSERKNAYTPLLWACKKGKMNVIKYFEQIRLPLTQTNKNGYSALMVAARNNHIEMINYLLSRGLKIDAKTTKGYTPLLYACEKGQLDAVKLLISKGASLNDLTSRKSSSLMLSCYSGNVKLIEFILQKGLPIEHKDQLGYTSFFWACERGNLEAVKFLLKKGAKYNISTSTGYNTIMAAAYSGNVEIVKTLMRLGMSVNYKDKYGYTVLMCACEKLNIDMVKFLLSQGLNVNSKDSQGRTAIDIASKYKFPELVTLLRSKN